jgi:hypothetical protein
VQNSSYIEHGGAHAEGREDQFDRDAARRAVHGVIGCDSNAVLPANPRERIEGEEMPGG